MAYFVDIGCKTVAAYSRTAIYGPINRNIDFGPSGRAVVKIVPGIGTGPIPVIVKPDMGVVVADFLKLNARNKRPGVKRPARKLLAFCR